MTIATPGSRWTRCARAGFAPALAVCAGLSAFSCAPGVATPVPEPPTLNLARVGPPTGAQPVSEPAVNGTHLYGSPGAAPSGALLRVTNLDGSDPPSAVSVLADGSFDVSLVVASGQELRFDWLRGDQVGAPQDAHFVNVPPPFRLEPSTRFACLTLTPGFVVDFRQAATQTLLVVNDCAAAVSLSTPRVRSACPTLRCKPRCRFSSHLVTARRSK